MSEIREWSWSEIVNGRPESFLGKHYIEKRDYMKLRAENEKLKKDHEEFATKVQKINANFADQLFEATKERDRLKALVRELVSIVESIPEPFTLTTQEEAVLTKAKAKLESDKNG